MRNFIVGAIGGLVLGSTVTVWAQLYPYDAPLDVRIAAENAALELQQRWQLDMIPGPKWHDPLGLKPCR